MDESDDVAVTLHIIEATGFNIRNDPIFIKASLGGSVLETNVATPTDQKTTFNHKLVWQTNRDAVKRIKVENQPIKLECFRVFGESDRESIGMLNIRLREIPFWNVRQSGTLKPHWYKLYGVSQDYRAQKPELYLCVTIGDPYTTSALQSSANSKTPEMQCSRYKELPILNIFMSQLGLGIQSLNNNAIKLGNDADDCYEFGVKIHIKHAEHLERLLSLSANSRRNNFAIEYRLFSERCVDAVQNELTGRFSIDETVTVNIQSTWANLLKYFREIFYIDLRILHDDGVIGSCKLSFGNGLMNLPESLNEFENVFASEDLTFCYDDYSKISATDSTINCDDSFLHYSFQLQYVKTIAMMPSKSNLSLLVPTDRSRLSSTTPPAINLDDMSSRAEQIEAGREVIGDCLARDERMIRSDSAKTIPRTFSYNLALIDCTFQRRPNPGIWQFSLHHENADNPMTIRNIEISDLNVDQICFEDLDLKLCFSTYSQHLMQLIQAKSCLLSLKGPKGFHASAELDNANVLAEEKSKGIVLLKNDSGEQVAMAHVSVEISDLGLNFNSRDHCAIRGRTDFSTKQSAVMFDENLAYKVVEELENWKQCQQQAFLMDLKRREIVLMTRLTSEWHRKRRDEEEKMEKRMKQNALLTRTLEDAYEALKERAEAEDMLEQSVQKSAKQMAKQFAAKTTVFQDRIRAMEEEQRKLKSDSEQRIRDVERQRDHSIAENEKLVLQQRRMEDAFRNEVAGLKAENQMLMEKLEAVHNSKQMYKEKWAILVRDVQKVRYENGSVSNEHNKMKDVINSARKEFTNDQIDLRQIKAQLPNVLRQ